MHARLSTTTSARCVVKPNARAAERSYRHVGGARRPRNAVTARANAPDGTSLEAVLEVRFSSSSASVRVPDRVFFDDA